MLVFVLVAGSKVVGLKGAEMELGSMRWAGWMSEKDDEGLGALKMLAIAVEIEPGGTCLLNREPLPDISLFPPPPPARRFFWRRYKKNAIRANIRAAPARPPMMPPAIAPALLVAEELAAVLDGVVFASTPVGTVVDELDWLVENVVDELLPMVEDENEDEDEEEEEEAVDEEAVLELVLIADELVWKVVVDAASAPMVLGSTSDVYRMESWRSEPMPI